MRQYIDSVEVKSLLLQVEKQNKDLERVLEEGRAFARILKNMPIAEEDGIKADGSVLPNPDELPLEHWQRSQLVEFAWSLGYQESDTRGKPVKDLRDMINTRRKIEGLPVAPLLPPVADVATSVPAKSAFTFKVRKAERKIG